jgi:hypothetical protein
MPQAASNFSVQRLGFNSRVLRVRIVMDKVMPGKKFSSRTLLSSC